MLQDARELESGTVLRTRVCVIGAGAAGITLAMEFNRLGVPCIVLESGGLGPTTEVTDLSVGDSTGEPLDPVAERVRFLGGATNHYDGVCKPLDEIDFVEIPGVREGWPITRAELLPYYERAFGVLNITDTDYSASHWMKPGFHETKRTMLEIYQAGSPVARMGEKYKDTLKAATAQTTLLFATVVELATNTDRSHVHAAEFKCPGGKRGRVEAESFVIAVGGLETPRLMLTAAKGEALGNRSGTVGQLICHPLVKAGFLVTSNARDTFELKSDGSYYRMLTLRQDYRRQLRLANLSLFLPKRNAEKDQAKSSPRYQSPDAVALASSVAKSMFRMTGGKSPCEAINEHVLIAYAEQLPSENSRVTLSDKRDMFGVRRLSVNWRLSEETQRHMSRNLEEIAIELGSTSTGRMRVDYSPGSPVIEGGAHHMGTARMTAVANKGVTDPSCRCHDVDNLYIAGSAVFATTGVANPTLTIVALALRLAGHLAQRVGR